MVQQTFYLFFFNSANVLMILPDAFSENLLKNHNYDISLSIVFNSAIYVLLYHILVSTNITGAGPILHFFPVWVGSPLLLCCNHNHCWDNLESRSQPRPSPSQTNSKELIMKIRISCAVTSVGLS